MGAVPFSPVPRYRNSAAYNGLAQSKQVYNPLYKYIIAPIEIKVKHYFENF